MAKVKQGHEKKVDASATEKFVDHQIAWSRQRDAKVKLRSDELHTIDQKTKQHLYAPKTGPEPATSGVVQMTSKKNELIEDRLIKKHGILHLLKKGLSVDDAHFNLLYPAPLASSSEKVKQNFADNVFSCTRQVRYSMANPLQEIDMVLFINGIPLITLELKNAWTGQTARYHGQKQYRDDRDAAQALYADYRLRY